MTFDNIAILGTGVMEIPPEGYGGIERYIFGLAKSLAERGNEVVIVNKVFSGFPELLRHFLFSLYLGLNSKKLKNKIIHVNTPLAAIFITIIGLKYIYTSHSRYWFHSPSILKSLLHQLDILAVGMSTITIAPSQRLKSKIDSSAFKPSNVIFIPPGVYVPDINLPVSRRKDLIIGFGAVIKEKRFDILAEATKTLQSEILIIGPIKDHNLQKRLSEINPRIQFLGELSDELINDLLSKARVLVHEADAELLPVTPLRAMAYGVPVIGSSEISDLIMDGQDGFIIPSNLDYLERIAFTSRYLHILMEDNTLWEKFSSSAVIDVLTRFSWKTIGEKVENVYYLFEEKFNGEK